MVGLGFKSLPALQLDFRKTFGVVEGPVVGDEVPQDGGGAWGAWSEFCGLGHRFPTLRLAPQLLSPFRLLVLVEAVPAISSVQSGKFHP